MTLEEVNMKKTKQRLLVSAVFVIMLFSLVACSGGGNPLVGKWTPVGDSVDTFGASDLEEIGVDSDDMVLEFTKDGQVNMLVQDKPIQDFMEEMMISLGMSESDAAEMVKEMEAEFDIKYKVDGDKLTMISNFGGESETAEGTFKISGNNLTISIDGESETFVKK